MQDFNFFKPYLGKKQERRDEKIYFYIAYGILIIVILFTLIFNVSRIISMDKDIKNYEQELNDPEMQAKLKEAQETSDKLQVLNKYESSLSGVVQAIAKNDIVTDDLLNDICGAMPAEVSFKDFKIDGYTLNIKGVTSTRAAVGELEHNLSELSEIKNVQVDKISKSNTVGEDYSFEMTCVIKEVE